MAGLGRPVALVRLTADWLDCVTNNVPWAVSHTAGSRATALLSYVEIIPVASYAPAKPVEAVRLEHAPFARAAVWRSAPRSAAPPRGSGRVGSSWTFAARAASPAHVRSPAGNFECVTGAETMGTNEHEGHGPDIQTGPPLYAANPNTRQPHLPSADIRQAAADTASTTAAVCRPPRPRPLQAYRRCLQ